MGEFRSAYLKMGGDQVLQQQHSMGRSPQVARTEEGDGEEENGYVVGRLREEAGWSPRTCCLPTWTGLAGPSPNGCGVPGLGPWNPCPRT